MDDFEPIEEHKDFDYDEKFDRKNFQPQENFEPVGNFEAFEPQNNSNFSDKFESFEPQQNHEEFHNFDSFDKFNNEENFEPINNTDNFEQYQSFEQTPIKEEKEENSSSSDEETEAAEEGKNITKTGLIITILILVGFSFILFYGLIAKNKKYQDIVIERPAPTNRVEELKIIPNFSPFKAGERFKFDISRDIFVEGNLSEVVLSFKIPESIPYRQKIDNLVIVPTPEKIAKEEDGTYAYVRIFKPQGSIQVHIAGFATVESYTAEKAAKIGKNIDGELSEEEKEKYLSPEKNIESNSEIIKTASAKYIPRATNELDTVKNIFDYVVALLRYDEKNVGKARGAMTALRQKSGACIEFADLMVALCRTKGIPARVQYGFDIPFQDLQRLSNNGHAWVEVYFPEYGWVMFDPTNKLSSNTIAKANALKITPYEFFAFAFQNRLYLIVDTNEIHMHYKGEGNIESENLHVKFLKR